MSFADDVACKAPWAMKARPAEVPAAASFDDDIACKAPWAVKAKPAQVPASAPAPVQNPALPRKRIHTEQDLQVFTTSKLCDQFMSFISELSGAVRGTAMSPDRLDSSSTVIQSLHGMLAELAGWIQEIPAIAQPMRFGNKAFCSWHGRLVERAHGLIDAVLRQVPALTEAKREALTPELAAYLCGSFGDERRIDYGTGHEAAFLAFVFVLGANNILAKADAADAVLVVFAAYIGVMRRLQSAYILEPAGSHGVWGLDDFHALPFLFGASQLIGMEEEVPTASVAEERTRRDYSDRYLYVDAVKEVLRVKSGAPFHESSPMLWDITAVPTWQKINDGLVRMYRAEVLAKFPVIQHFLFGPTLRWPGDISAGAAPVPPAVVPSVASAEPQEGETSSEAA